MQTHRKQTNRRRKRKAILGPAIRVLCMLRVLRLVKILIQFELHEDWPGKILLLCTDIEFSYPLHVHTTRNIQHAYSNRDMAKTNTSQVHTAVCPAKVLKLSAQKSLWSHTLYSTFSCYRYMYVYLGALKTVSYYNFKYQLTITNLHPTPHQSQPNL